MYEQKENDLKYPLQMEKKSEEKDNIGDRWTHLHQYRYEWNFGHYLAVLSIANNGRWVATCGDEKFSVFDIFKQKSVYHTSFERSVKVTAFNNQSTMLAYGLYSLVILNTESWTVDMDIPVEKRIYNIRFSKDDSECYVTTMEEIKIFNIQQQRFTETFKVEGVVKAFDICTANKFMAYGGKDYGLYLVDLEKLRGGDISALNTYALNFKHDYYPRICSFSPDGKQIAWGGHKKVLVMEIEKPTDVREMYVDPEKVKTRAIHFSQDSRYIVYGGVNTHVMVVDVMSGEPHFVFEGFGEGIWDAKFSPDNEWVVACSYNRKMTFLRLGNPKPPPVYTIEERIGKAKKVYFSNSANNLLLKTAEGEMQLAELGQAATSEQLVLKQGLSHHFQAQKKAIGYISARGTYAVWMPEFDGQGHVVDLEQDLHVSKFMHGDMQAHNVVISEDDSLVMSDSDGVVYISELTTGEFMYKKKFPHGTTYVAFSSCSNYIAACTGSGVSVIRLDKKDGLKAAGPKLEPKKKMIKKQSLRMLKSVGMSNIEEEEEKMNQLEEQEAWLGTHEDYTQCCAFVPQNSRQIASCSVDCTVRIWDLDHQQISKLINENQDESDQPETDPINLLVPIAEYQHQSVVDYLAWSFKTPGILLSYTDKGVVSVFDTQLNKGKGGRVYIRKCGEKNLVGAGFTQVTKQSTASKTEELDNVLIVTKDSVTLISVDLILQSGPAVDCFIDACDVDKDYLSYTLQKFPYLGSTLGSTVLSPQKINVAEKCVELDSQELMDSVLSVCPGSAFANGGVALKCALKKGNKNLLMRLLLAALKDGVSHKGREEIMLNIKDILLKAPEVLAEVLKNTDMESYEVEGIKYAHLLVRELRPSKNWGCGDLWEDERQEYDCRKALDSKDPTLAHKVYNELGEDALKILGTKADPINKVGLFRVPLPGIADIEVLEAFYEAGVLELFDNKVISCVLSCLWRDFFKRRFNYLFAFHLTMFIINLASAVANNQVEGTGQSTTAIALSIVLIIISTYNILYEILQLKKGGIWDAIGDFWSWLDWTYYTCVLIAGILSVTSTYGYQQLGAVNVIMSSMEMLFYMRGFKAVGFLISALTQAVADLGPFLLVTFLLLLAFSGSFYTLMDIHLLEENAGGGDLLYDQWWKVLLHSYFALLGIVFSQDIFEATILPGLAMFLFVIFTLFTLIVMLNLIISILCATFSHVQLYASAEGLRERCAIILELSYYMRAHEYDSVKANFRWIHVMAPISSGTDDDIIGDSADEKVSALGKNIDRVKQADAQAQVAGNLLEESKEKLKELEKELAHAHHVKHLLARGDNINTHLGGERPQTVHTRYVYGIGRRHSAYSMASERGSLALI